MSNNLSNKIHINLTLEYEIYYALKASGVNISELANSLLSSYVEYETLEESKIDNKNLQIYKLALQKVEENKKIREEQKAKMSKIVEEPKSKEDKFQEAVAKLREKYKEKVKILKDEEYKELAKINIQKFKRKKSNDYL